MMPTYVNLNGQLLPAGEARVSILDHGLLYGDGVFETLRVCNGRIFRAEAHLARLELRIPWSVGDLGLALESVVEANTLREAALRLTVTRGEGSPIPDPTTCPEPAFFITARALPAEASRGEVVWTALVTGTHPQTFVPGIKCLSYLPFQQARTEARRRGYDEAILTFGQNVIEASTSNLFAVVDGRLWTPDLQSGCLPGIARDILLGLASAVGLEPYEAALPSGELATAGEVLASNSLMGPVPVLRVNDWKIGGGVPGPVAVRLSELYSELLRSA